MTGEIKNSVFYGFVDNFFVKVTFNKPTIYWYK